MNDQPIENKPSNVNTGTQKGKIEVKDVNESDKRIPRDLIIMYQGKPYITKAGLCWKMNYLFGGRSWGVTNEIIERKEDYVLVRATLKLDNGIEFNNFGEASKANVSNPMMLKYLLHLAITRAENRVMRTATACGYTSIEEISGDISENGVKELPVNEKDGEPATEQQKTTIVSLGGKVEDNMSFGQAKQLIASLATKK